MNTRRNARAQQGFSLLEMVVAVAILGLALGALYQSVGGATRNVRADQRYAYAVELGRSLIADNSVVPLQGLQKSGETSGGFVWQVAAAPLDRPRGSSLAGGRLQRIDVTVAWPDGTRERQISLSSVVAGELR
ncbi:MAG: prepilin-type N-terminal cleavage/methylation domain-containing protein [Congregibacter sp.]|nr:prepilin-type N-terminal cleavage/methylation domain-containing protein [Congregibacter sp.]